MFNFLFFQRREVKETKDVKNLKEFRDSLTDEEIKRLEDRLNDPKTVVEQGMGVYGD